MAVTPYTTPAEMLTELGNQLYDILELDRGDVAVLTSDRLLQGIARANDLVDSYLRGRYELPLQAVPAVLSSHAAALARWEILKGRPDTTQVDGMDAKHQKEALDYLKALAVGTARLDVDQGSETVVNGARLARLGEGVDSTNPEACWVDRF